MPDVTQVVFTTQPSDTVVNTTILPAIEAELRDELGDIVPTATNTVTVAIEDNPGGGTLSGTLTKNAIGGIATFDDLKIDQPGLDYTFKVSVELLAFDPNGDGATLWLHGTDSSFTGLTDGTVIGQSGVTPWPNRAIAVGGNWTRVDSSRPSFRNLVGPNDEPYVEFSGPPTTEELNGFSEGVYFSANAYHIFAVVRPDSENVSLMFNGPETSLNVQASKFKFTHNASSVTWPTDISVGTWYLVEISFGLGTLSLRVNNGSPPVSLPGVANLGFGVASAMGIHGPCGIAEIITFNVRLATDVGAVYTNGLLTKYIV